MVADSTRRRRSERTSRPAPHEDSAAESPKRTQPARRTKLVTKDSTEDLAQTSEDNGTYLLEDDFTGESRVVDPRVASGRKMNFQQLDRLPLHEKLRPEDEDDMDIAEEGNGGIANGHDKVYEDGLAPKAAATGILGDDFPNFVLLLLLYCLQGVPLGRTP